ncbi:uncharacterized protein PITG_08668 [Phytophthora infestans T30-4]|uniref:Uncharacterized protein n=1 Tax=Phytophthora infestans (strain T30-4) TaxID=403677 RepID=D0NCW6_PHYIT|nr:uncharacterized protein PITG_08668 [Phytophthora infestans T30-4]EEY55923.1 hypothetical protein PITG_08668 [Phytophthora infestans T30-4]|eukprot:XP_002902753.1 hypothetical protein PITG_08668 [Phytophthora infestans T30-4]
MSNEAKPLTPLLTLAVAKAGTSEEEQQTQSMMYAARMTYLDNSEQRSPDPMFLTRKQAQKMAQQQQEGLKMPLRRLEKMNTARTANGFTTISWKRSKAAMAALEKHKTWKPRFQAGCHFYECVETGECRSEADSDDDDPPFPDSFAFLNDPRK